MTDRLDKALADGRLLVAVEGEPGSPPAFHEGGYARIVPPGANGELKLRANLWGLWQTIHIVGGPFAVAPTEGAFNVCLLEQDDLRADVWFPIVDFSVPEDEDETLLALRTVIEAALAGKFVYVGCMAGRGRTGLFLSLIAKVMGIPNPVEYVRKHYYEHAVETEKQYAYVSKFPAWKLKWWLLRTVFKDMRGTL